VPCPVRDGCNRSLSRCCSRTAERRAVQRLLLPPLGEKGPVKKVRVCNACLRNCEVFALFACRPPARFLTVFPLSGCGTANERTLCTRGVRVQTYVFCHAETSTQGAATRMPALLPGGLSAAFAHDCCIEYALSEGGGAGAESSKRESVSGRLLQTANTNAACSFDDGRMQLADKLPLSTLSTAEVSEAPLPCAPQGKCVSLTCSPARAASSAAVLRCRPTLVRLHPWLTEASGVREQTPIHGAEAQGQEQGEDGASAAQAAGKQGVAAAARASVSAPADRAGLSPTPNLHSEYYHGGRRAGACLCSCSACLSVM